MAESDFYIRQGDTASPLTDTLRDENGDAVDLNGATIRWTMAPVGGGPAKIDGRVAENLQVGDGSDGTKGKVRLEWEAADTDTAEDYLGSWEVTYATDETQTFPNAGYLLVSVTPDQPTTRAYLTRAEFKRTHNLTGSGADAEIDWALAGAIAGLEEWYGGPWSLGEAGEVRYFTPLHGMTTIELGQLAAVTEVAVDTAGNGTFGKILQADVDYRLEPVGAGGVADGDAPWTTLRFLRTGFAWSWEYDPLTHPWPWGRDSVRITGTWGGAKAPAGLKAATAIVAERILKRIREAPFGILQIGTEGRAAYARDIARDPEVTLLMRGARRREKAGGLFV